MIDRPITSGYRIDAMRIDRVDTGGRRGRGLEARVMLPALNRRDYDDIPAGALEKLEFVWLERVDDANRCRVGGE